MQKHVQVKSAKRLNAMLPDVLATYVANITGEGGEYETPSEFVRDLIRRHMEKTQEQERRNVEILLAQSLAENRYATWTEQDMQELRDMAK